MPPRAKAAGGKGKGRKPKNGHVLSAELPAGTILRDYTKTEWKLGKPVGSGGFGLIYLADKNHTGSVSPSAPYVIKVEPHDNGPLFCELHFYQRVAKSNMIKEWMSEQKLKMLGMPQFVAHGAHVDSQSDKQRFLVMERFGVDLQKIFVDNGKRFPRKTVLSLGIKLVDVLEYIHSKEYCHADIKASNLLLGFKASTVNQVYLVDYGLAFRYTTDGKHRACKADPKWKHNGTIEFTSRDAHEGLTPSRRGDLEILAYCLLQWLCGQLPWEDKLTDCNYVQQQKNLYMSDIPRLMRKCFPAGGLPAELSELLHYIVSLEYDEQPDYDHCRQILRTALCKLGGSETAKLVFTAEKKQLASPLGKKRQNDSIDSDDFEEEDTVQKKRARIKSPVPVKHSTAKKITPKGKTTKKAVPAKKTTTTPRGKTAVVPQGKTTPKPATPRGTAAPRAATPRGKTTPKAVKPRGTTAPKAATPLKKPHSAVVNKRLLAKANVACQTSPGLKGLVRSRKKTK